MIAPTVRGSRAEAELRTSGESSSDELSDEKQRENRPNDDVCDPGVYQPVSHGLRAEERLNAPLQEPRKRSPRHVRTDRRKRLCYWGEAPEEGELKRLTG